MRARGIALAFLLAALLPAAPQSVRAAANTACAQCWWETGSPAYAGLGAYRSFQVTYESSFAVNMTGIVFMVVHNSLGQTVEYSTATLPLPAGGNGTAYLVTFGLPPGSYSATFFVVSPSGTAISSAVTKSFTV